MKAQRKGIGVEKRYLLEGGSPNILDVDPNGQPACDTRQISPQSQGELLSGVIPMYMNENKTNWGDKTER